MDDVEDELDLKYHRGLNPDVYYRCPCTESLDGALRNELAKNAASFIPTEIVTEFIFGISSTITISVAQQPNLDLLFEPADYLQSIPVEHALCRSFNGKERLKLQRAIARCLVEAIEAIDGFKYIERRAINKEGSAGCRFRFVCSSSLQNRRVKRKAKGGDSEDENVSHENQSKHDCGGAIHIKFSAERDAINIVYKHSPIHGTPEADQESPLPALDPDATAQNATNGSSSDTKTLKRKRSRNKKTRSDTDVDLDGLTIDSPASLAAPTASKKKRKKADSPATKPLSSAKQSKKGKQSSSPTKSRKKASAREPTPPPAQIVKGKCLRCKERNIRCNEAKPSCNQCRRGLWTCQYEIIGPKKRSKNGCINCKARRRKCTEERPFCAYCLKVDDDCEYQNDA